MAILDTLSGFEFEDVMEDVFRNLGYENVRKAPRSADEGRDIVMEEVIDDERRAIIVECKHTGQVGRPMVQKLHSAIATYDFAGPKRGILVTSGRFSRPAREYVKKLNNGSTFPIELIDGRDLRELADEIGLNLYNGRIEILCEETLRPLDPAGSLHAPVTAAFRDIENIDADEIPAPTATVTFRPMVIIAAKTNAVFETSVGVVHRINKATRLVIHADRGNTTIADASVASLVTGNRHAAIELDAHTFETVFDRVTTRRFGKTQTEYKETAISLLRDRQTTTVRYTGDNNVTYTKTCKPKQSDISVTDIDAVYLPQITQTTTFEQYEYPYEYFAAGPSRVTTEDRIHACVHCDTSGADDQYTFCANCTAIACQRHTKVERLEGTPICTGCAIIERFAFKRKYFYSEANLETFKETYAAMPIHRKAMENKALVAGVILVGVLVLVGLFGLLGGS